jgi:AbrB family looped-hinge helix DNA binding protein
MATRVTVSGDFQINVPDEARVQLHLKAGDHLLIEIRDGSIVLVPEPTDYVQRLRGLHREVWEGIDAQAYVSGEREM